MAVPFRFCMAGPCGRRQRPRVPARVGIDLPVRLASVGYRDTAGEAPRVRQRDHFCGVAPILIRNGSSTFGSLPASRCGGPGSAGCLCNHRLALDRWRDRMGRRKLMPGRQDTVFAIESRFFLFSYFAAPSALLTGRLEGCPCYPRGLCLICRLGGEGAGVGWAWA